MRPLAPLLVIACCCACHRAPAADPQPLRPEPSNAPLTSTPPSPAPTDPLPAASTRPPVDGLEHWAAVSLTPEQFIARAKESGLQIDQVVEVSDLTQLVAALADNTAIIVDPGRHVFEDSNLLAEPAVKAKLPDWSRYSDHYDDGEIHDLHDVAIVGAGPDPTVIIQPDSYAHVLAFRNVKGLALHGLVLGHRPDAGWCRGGVVKVIESSNVIVSESTLFGSGTEGLTLVTVDGLRIQDSVITDCSQSFSTISHSRGISYERVRVAGNAGDLLHGFAIYRSDVSLSDCTLADNHPLPWDETNAHGQLFYVDGDYDMARWFVDEPRALEPERTRSEIHLRNTTVDGERITRDLP